MHCLVFKEHFLLTSKVSLYILTQEVYLVKNFFYLFFVFNNFLLLSCPLVECLIIISTINHFVNIFFVIFLHFLIKIL